MLLKRIGSLGVVATAALAVGLALICVAYLFFDTKDVHVNLTTEGVGVFVGGFVVAAVFDSLNRRDHRRAWAECHNYILEAYRSALLRLYRDVARVLRWELHLKRPEPLDLAWVADELVVSGEQPDFMNVVSSPPFRLDPEASIGALVDRLTLTLVTLSEDPEFVLAAMELASALEEWRGYGQPYWDAQYQHYHHPKEERTVSVLEEAPQAAGGGSYVSTSLIPGTGTILPEMASEATGPTKRLLRAAQKLHEALPKEKQFTVLLDDDRRPISRQE